MLLAKAVGALVVSRRIRNVHVSVVGGGWRKNSSEKGFKVTRMVVIVSKFGFMEFVCNRLVIVRIEMLTFEKREKRTRIIICHVLLSLNYSGSLKAKVFSVDVKLKLKRDVWSEYS